jgi:hypothetical protein
MKKTNSLVVGLSANLVSRSFTVSTVNKSETVQLSVTGTYSDNSTKAVDTHITYVIIPVDYAKVNGSVLTALKDGNVTVQAKVGTTLSNTINLNITWIVNGHVLPPEPDPTVNNSTLLGIDSNHNGVRDDVERWIYEEYDHPIERGIFMQSARAYNKVIVDPSKAHETVKYSDNVLSCEFYWIYKKTPRPFDKYEHFSHSKKLKKIQFNTLKRHIAYERFNGEFNGEVFGAPATSKDKCEFDEQGNLKAIK